MDAKSTEHAELPGSDVGVARVIIELSFERRAPEVNAKGVNAEEGSSGLPARVT